MDDGRSGDQAVGNRGRIGDMKGRRQQSNPRIDGRSPPLKSWHYQSRQPVPQNRTLFRVTAFRSKDAILSFKHDHC